MIAVLPAHVIDQIAAGEVIERPASVVKELVDNAIDAGGSTIAIDVAAGGRALIRVTDDGCGMSRDAAVLALERHATSKLREVDDLWGITSMGFRGEALPSIASVSRMTLTTRRAGDDAATRLVIEAGRLVEVTEAGAAVGTTVEVTDLLHNLPARLKFLKGEATEASHVTDMVAKVAMAYPRLHLKLRHNGRTSLDAPPDRDGFARAQALLGPRIAARMIPVLGEETGVRVTGYLGAPELAQATARGVQLFVGRRPIRDRNLLHALTMGYGELIPRGRYPLAVVLVDVPAGAVDVNVHPQKLEVRFSDAAVVAAAVRHVVQAGIHAARWRDEAGGAAPVQMIASVAPPVLPFDGRVATQLSERHVAQMKSRQVPLGFAAPEVAALATAVRGAAINPAPGASASPAPGASANPAPGASANPAPGASAYPAPGAPSLSASPAAARGGTGAGPERGPSASPAQSAREWARALREQTQAARGADPRPPADHGERSNLPAADPRAHDGPDPAVSTSEGESQGSTGATAQMPEQLRAPATSGALSDAVATGPDRAGDAALAAPGYFAQLRYLGQLDLTYLTCEGHGELVLVDQHAAHERVELARLRARSQRGRGADAVAGDAADARVAVQKLLFPITFEASPAQIALVGSVGEVLAQVGFEVEPFGKATLAVRSVPASLRHGDPAELLRSLLEQWADAGAPSEADRLDALLGEIACHSAVRAGDRLGTGEAEALLRALDGVDLASPAPHGRAVLLRLPISEIGRRFGRT